MNEGDTVELTFDSVAPRGDAIASTGADRPVIAAGVVPGETALVEIRRIRRRWIAVDVAEITTPSPHRVTPRCPLFETCAGCQLQHIAYPHQLVLKRDMVRKQLAESWAATDLPIREVIGAPDPWHYRNHARFTVEEGALGFVRRYKHAFFEVPHCDIMRPEINAVLRTLSGRAGRRGACNVRIGTGPEPMVHPKLDPALDETLAAEGSPVPSGQPYLEETLLGARFRVSAAAFFQVHRAQAETMVKVIAAALDDAIGDDPDAVVVDAYAGVGTFAVLLAGPLRIGAGRIISIEENESAVADALHNVAQNLGDDSGPTRRPTVEVVCGKAEELLARGDLALSKHRVDAVILDPPRSGCRPAAIAAVCEHAPDVVVYVSCHAASLGRDLALLCGTDDEPGPFAVDVIQPIDMFPQTHHIECVAVLKRRS